MRGLREKFWYACQSFKHMEFELDASKNTWNNDKQTQSQEQGKMTRNVHKNDWNA